MAVGWRGVVARLFVASAGFAAFAVAPQVRAIDATWNANAVGNWSDPANWSTNPDIPNSAAYDVFINDGETTLDGEFTTGDLNWNGGALVGTGQLTVNLDTTIGGAGTKLLGGPTINLVGDATWAQGNIASSDPPEGGVVNIGGDFDIQVDASWTCNMTKSPVINVAATASVVKSAGNGSAILLPAVNNSGNVHVQSGTLRLGGGGTSSGKFTVDDGEELEFSDRHAALAAAGAPITTLSAASVVDADDGGLVRFVHGTSDSQTEILGAVDATVLEADPGATGHVSFRSGSTYGAHERGSITANSGTTTIDNAVASVADVIVNGATIEVVNDGLLNISGAINVNEGGVLRIGDATPPSHVVLDGAASQLITGGGQIELGGTGNVLEAKRRVVIDEDVTIHGRGQIIGATKPASATNGNNLGTIKSDIAGGTIRTDLLNNSNTIEGTGGGSVDFRDAVNMSTISVTGGGNLLTTNIVNRGVLTIHDGTLELNGNDWDNVAGLGTINALNASIFLHGDFTQQNVGTINRTSSEVFMQGTLQNAGSTLNLNAATGSWIVNGGGAVSRIVGGSVQSIAGAELVFRGQGGVLQGVTLNSAPRFEDGSTVFVSNGLTLNNATVDLSNENQGSSDFVFVEDGPRFINGTGTVVLGNAFNRGIENLVGPQATIGPNVSIRGQRGQLLGGLNPILLQGSVSADVDDGLINLFHVIIDAGGVAEAKNGAELQLNGAWENNGTIRVRDGSTVGLGGTFDLDDIGSIVRTETSTVQLIGVLNNAGQTFDVHTTTGPLVLRTGGQVLGGRITSSGASTLLIDHADLGGPLFNGVTLAMDLGFTVGNGGNLNVLGNLPLDNVKINMGGSGIDRAITFSGTESQTLGGSGEIMLNGFIRNSMTNSAKLTIGPNILIHGNGIVDGHVTTTAGGVINQGTIRAEGFGVTLMLRQATNDGGSIRALPNTTLQISLPSFGETTFVQTSGQLSVAAMASIVADRGIDIRGGTLSGSGKIQILADAFPNNFVRVTGGAVLSPGEPLGTLTVDGDVVVGSEGHLAIDLSGSLSDALQIIKGGPLQPAEGSLDLSSTNDFLDVTVGEPLTAVKYLIASYAGTLKGTFDHVTPGFNVTYDAAQKKIFLIAPPRADFDLDNDVDGNDFLVWQRGVGLSENATRQQGDANGDGRVDGADLAILQTQFGLSPAVAAASAVPEPAGICLALFALGWAASRRRR